MTLFKLLLISFIFNGYLLLMIIINPREKISWKTILEILAEICVQFFLIFKFFSKISGVSAKLLAAIYIEFKKNFLNFHGKYAEIR